MGIGSALQFTAGLAKPHCNLCSLRICHCSLIALYTAHIAVCTMAASNKWTTFTILCKYL
uniref:Uncharacterized protein n=1 Tax=Anguilla anguilla TaxID=7936 RepID=A0A0E9X637_ANGAN